MVHNSVIHNSVKAECKNLTDCKMISNKVPNGYGSFFTVIFTSNFWIFSLSMFCSHSTAALWTYLERMKIVHMLCSCVFLSHSCCRISSSFFSSWKPVNSHWFKSLCLMCLVVSCIHSFLIKFWNSIRLSVLL